MMLGLSASCPAPSDPITGTTCPAGSSLLPDYIATPPNAACLTYACQYSGSTGAIAPTGWTGPTPQAAAMATPALTSSAPTSTAASTTPTFPLWACIGSAAAIALFAPGDWKFAAAIPAGLGLVEYTVMGFSGD
jgi:hypothetical protein